MPVPRVLVVAGSDSSGGAGIEADSRVLAVHGVYGMTAITALTIQNTQGVQDVIVTPAEAVARLIRANLDDIGCDVVKIGMLASARTVEVVADTLKELHVKNIVLDPVMISTSGSQLLPGDAVRIMREELIPMCTVLTPNIPEATLLLRDADIHYKSPSNLTDLVELAHKVHQLGPQTVLLKGGHMPLNKDTNEKALNDSDKHITVDILYDGTTTTTVTSPFQNTTSTHGTGCSLASAIAANLALQISESSTSTTTPPTIALPSILPSIIKTSIAYVGEGIRTASPNLGSGPGPINHFHNSYHLPFSRGHFIPYLLSHPLVLQPWHNYTHHTFPTQLARNTLPLPKFKAYLIQDYLFLNHFARVHAISAYKSPSMSRGILAATRMIRDIETEMNLHLSYCTSGFGISEAEILETPESLACVAYSRYVLDVAMSQDGMALQIALLPCLLGYAVTATRLRGDPESVVGAVVGGLLADDDIVSSGNVNGTIVAAAASSSSSSPSPSSPESTPPGGGGGGGGNNKYWRWIETYSGPEYLDSVERGKTVIEEEIVKQSPGRIEELVKIFVRATEMEAAFWDL